MDQGLIPSSFGDFCREDTGDCKEKHVADGQNDEGQASHDGVGGRLPPVPCQLSQLPCCSTRGATVPEDGLLLMMYGVVDSLLGSVLMDQEAQDAPEGCTSDGDEDTQKGSEQGAIPLTQRDCRAEYQAAGPVDPSTGEDV